MRGGGEDGGEGTGGYYLSREIGHGTKKVPTHLLLCHSSKDKESI